MTAIEKSPEQALDYGQAILEVEKAAKANNVVDRRMQELVTAAKADPPPKIDKFLEDIKETIKETIKELKPENLTEKNNQKFVEEIKDTKGAVTVGENIHIENQENKYYLSQPLELPLPKRQEQEIEDEDKDYLSQPFVLPIEIQQREMA